MSLIGFSLTWDWAQDFLREVNKNQSEDLLLLADQLTPFTKNYLVNMVTVLDDEDLKVMGKFSEESLTDKYLASLDDLKAAEPAHGGKDKFRPFKAIKETI